MSSNLKNEKAAAEAKDIEVNVDAVGVENPLSTGKFVDRAFQLNYWDPEDNIFYAKEGEAIANRNLICSIPNLFLGFAIWLMWSATVVVIQEAYDASKAACVAAGDTAVDCPTYHFSGWIKPGDNYKAILYTIPAIAGLAGGVMRCVNTFMIPISGGRVTVVCTTVALLIPCIWAAVILKSKDASFTQLVICAALTGVGGGAFSSSMNNISLFFPKRKQGLALGLNAGFGNLGVPMSQLLIGPICGYAAFGGSAAGADTWGGNAGAFYTVLCAIAICMAACGMSNMPATTHELVSVANCVFKWLWLHAIGMLATGVATGVLIATSVSVTSAFDAPSDSIGRVIMLVIVAVIVVHALIWYCVPPQVKTKVVDQSVIFSNKHNYVMTYLYIMTFGSFIGFSGAFPKLLKDLFGYLPDGTVNPDAPNVLYYAWIGPAVGSLIRPVGGYMSDKFGGALVTQVHTVIQTFASVACGILCWQARERLNDGKENLDLFPPFVFMFVVLFYCTGVGNGSTFRMIAIIFEKHEAAGVLGWSSAIASFGAYIIPALFGVAIKQKSPQTVMYFMAAYYFSCIGMNHWYYLRKGCEKPC